LKERIQNTEDSLAADRWGGQFDRRGNFKREYRISNNECRMSKEKPFEILRFDILLFCGSLFRTGEVSYKNTELRATSNLRLATRYEKLVLGNGQRTRVARTSSACPWCMG
jgi:hypothetical protein